MKIKDRDYTIRTMSQKEVDIAIEWAAKEGWNPGFYDADCYYSADPNGFLIGLLDDEPIATISVIKYSESFGFLGFYIVKPEYRGMGYGMQIWNAGLNYLKDLNIGLDGVVLQQDNYKKSAFKLAYRNIRFAGCGGGKASNSPAIVKLATLDFESIDLYEQLLFPEKRSRFIKSWINQPDSHALGIIQNDKLSGYGVIRQCHNGYKIGPLYADSPELADSLFLELKSRVDANQPVFLDIPETNRQAMALAERYNLEKVFETARMYTGKIPVIPMDRIFGVTSFEIG